MLFFSLLINKSESERALGVYNFPAASSLIETPRYYCRHSSGVSCKPSKGVAQIVLSAVISLVSPLNRAPQCAPSRFDGVLMLKGATSVRSHVDSSLALGTDWE